MNRLLLLCVFAISGLINLFGQSRIGNQEFRKAGDISFGVSAGLTTSTISYPDGFDRDELSRGNSYIVSVQTNYFANHNWSIKAKLSYENRKFGSRAEMSYVSLPLMASWHFGKNRRWNLQFGGAYSLALEDSETAPGTSMELFPSSFGGDVGIGVVIPFNKLKFYIEADGVIDSHTIDFPITDLNQNPIGVFELTKSRMALNFGILF